MRLSCSADEGKPMLFILPRLAGYHHYQNQKYTAPASMTGKPDKFEDKKESRTISSHIAQVKTIHIPKTTTAAPFLKHPDLTLGQKRYLWSIARIYSTSFMRTCIKRQYTTLSHHQKQLGAPRCTGLNTSQENQAKPESSQRQHTWIKRKKTSQSAKPTLTPISSAHSPSARDGKLNFPHKQRLKPGALPRTENKSHRIQQSSRDREPLKQLVSAHQSASGESEQKTEDELMSESLNSISIEAD
ncbi:protein FAM216A isoform X2 [Microcaecilia unicolor]|uniref:Protein FAM216A isoform X2 n=1 Tax=Microcaecilia unicolor TaxID=1415580 RepID=A0A6P7ZEV5_9AMPH|nr:protein FAM216A isoform X2 [Microcaecilia unicolor]